MVKEATKNHWTNKKARDNLSAIENTMLAGFLIAFRESLEASLIVGVILSYLRRTRQTQYNNTVYIGIAAGVVGSIIGAYIFHAVAGGFSGRTEEIFEGATMLIGAALLTSMIIWMMRQRKVAQQLEEKVEKSIQSTQQFELFFLVFVAILREGIETVIFMNAAITLSQGSTIRGAILGLIAAVALGYLLFVKSLKINIKKFFTATSVLLILFAAGLIAHGIHEFQEAGIVPIVIEHLWDINPTTLSDGTYPILHEKGMLGSIFKGLFGYNGNPSLIEVLSYILYLVGISFVWKRITQEKRVV